MKTRTHKTKAVARKTKAAKRPNNLPRRIAAAPSERQKFELAFYDRERTPAFRLAEQWRFLQTWGDYKTNPRHAKQLANLDRTNKRNAASAYSQLYDDALRETADMFAMPMLQGDAAFFRRFADEMEAAQSWDGPAHLESAAVLANENVSTAQPDGTLAPRNNTALAEIIAAHKWPEQSGLSPAAQRRHDDLRENAADAARKNVTRTRARLGLPRRDK